MLLIADFLLSFIDFQAFLQLSSKDSLELISYSSFSTAGKNSYDLNWKVNFGSCLAVGNSQR